MSISGWRREGNINEVLKEADPSIYLGFIEYVNYTSFSLAQHIQVTVKKDFSLDVAIYGSGYHVEQWLKLLAQYFPRKLKERDETLPGHSEIYAFYTIDSEDACERYLKFLQMIHDVSDAVSMSVIDDIRSMYHFVSSAEKLGKAYEHKIEAYMHPCVRNESKLYVGNINWVCDSYYDPSALFLSCSDDYFYNDIADVDIYFAIVSYVALQNSESCLYSHSELMKTVKRLLKSGQNPNQCTPGGETLLDFSAMALDFELMELLFCYGADPFEVFGKAGSFFNNVLLNARHPGMLDILHLLQSYISRPKKSLDTKVDGVAIVRKGRQIVTKFAFDNKKTLYATLKRNEEMTLSEIAYVKYTIISNFSMMDDPDKKKIIAAANDEIYAKDCRIELIRFDGELIGFVLTQMKIMDDKKACQLYCRLGYVDAKFRNYGLLKLLIFRSGYSLQLMRPSYEVSVLYVAVSHYSNQLVDEYLAYPKYQPDYLTSEYVANMFGYYTGVTRRLIQRDMASYFEDDMMLNSPIEVRSYNDKRFYNEILDLNGVSNTLGRGAAVFFYIDKEKYEWMTYGCLKLGVDFYQYILRIAECFSVMRNESLAVLPALPFRAGGTLFWNTPPVYPDSQAPAFDPLRAQL